MARGSCTLACVPLFAALALAQLPTTRSGDYVVADNVAAATPRLVAVDKVTGALTTIATFTAPVSAVIMDYNNRDYVVGVGSTVLRLSLATGGRTQLFQLPAGGLVTGLSLDQDGRSYYVVQNFTPTNTQIFFGAPTVPPTPPPLYTQVPSFVTGFALHMKSPSQHFLISVRSLVSGSGLLRVPRPPGPVIPSPIPGVPSTIQGFVQDQDLAGTLYAITRQSGVPGSERLSRIHPDLGIVQPFPAPTPILQNATAIVFQGANGPESPRRLLAVVSNQNPSPAAAGVVLFNPLTGAQVRTVSPVQFNGAALLRNRDREITGTVEQVPGGYRFRFNLAGPLPGGDAPNEQYIAGLSQDTDPGIILADGRKIPLNPDPFFVLSQFLGPPVFNNFTGTLNGNSEAVPLPTIDLSTICACSGYRFYISYVSINCAYSPSTCVHVIADAWSVIIP